MNSSNTSTINIDTAKMSEKVIEANFNVPLNLVKKIESEAKNIKKNQFFRYLKHKADIDDVLKRVGYEIDTINLSKECTIRAFRGGSDVTENATKLPNEHIDYIKRSIEAKLALC